MALSATPSVSEIRTAIRANSLYAINGSLTECRDYIEAIHAALLLPTRANKGAESVEYTPSVLQRLLDAAEQWYARNATSGVSSTRYFGTSRGGRY